MKRRLVGLLCGFIACLGWHMAQAGAQELEINLPVEFETLQIIMTDEHQTWLAGYTGEPMSSKPAVLQVTSEGEMRCFEEDATDSSFFFSASLSPDRWILLRTEDGPTSPTEAVVMENGEVEQRIRGLGKAKGVFPVEDGYLFTTMANAGNGSVEMRDAQGHQLWQMELPHMSWVRDVVEESDGFYLTGNYQPSLEDDPLGVVIKLDKAGNVLWRYESEGSEQYDQGYLAEDHDAVVVLGSAYPALPKDSALSPVIAKIQAGELIWHEAYIDPENPYPLDQKFLSAIRVGTDFLIASQKGNASGIISMLAYDADGQLTAAWIESVQPIHRAGNVMFTLEGDSLFLTAEGTANHFQNAVLRKIPIDLPNKVPVR